MILKTVGFVQFLFYTIIESNDYKIVIEVDDGTLTVLYMLNSFF